MDERRIYHKYAHDLSIGVIRLQSEPVVAVHCSLVEALNSASTECHGRVDIVRALSILEKEAAQWHKSQRRNTAWCEMEECEDYFQELRQMWRKPEKYQGPEARWWKDKILSDGPSWRFMFPREADNWNALCAWSRAYCQEAVEAIDALVASFDSDIEAATKKVEAVV